MNSPICLLCQWIGARRLDDGTDEPCWVGRHRARCPVCRAELDRHRRVMTLLVEKARGTLRQPPPFLRARILANLDSETPKERSFNWAVMMAAGATALLLVIAIQSGLVQKGGRTAALPPEEGAIAVLPELSGQMLALGTNLDAPLEGELTLVVDDARSAVIGLARSFVPSDFVGR